jgi:glutamate dehydrogenase
VRLVLRDNTQQTRLLVRELQAQSDVAVQKGYAALIASLEEEGALSRELEMLPSVAELARRKGDNRGLTTPELAVVIANVKNRYKRILGAMPLTDESWAESVLRPYFPELLVATRSPLAHPLANAILATVLANEVVNRCGPLMLRNLAAEHGVQETDVILAWGQAWSALNLAPVFDTLDADALEVPREVSMAVDARSRAALRAVMEGVLAVPKDQLRASAGIAELARLFDEPDAASRLAPAGAASEADAAPGLRPGFAAAWKALEGIEGISAFVFAALSVQRPEGMDLPAFLALGTTLRSKAGIDALERGLALPATSRSQEQLRSYAQQALRRTQQRLLAQVLARAAGHGSGAVDAVIASLNLPAFVTPADLEQAMLDVWTLSEAVNDGAGGQQKAA